MRLILFHPMDPRGRKLGGIETHVRLMLARAPRSWSVLFVGIDEEGDRALGRIHPIVYEGRPIDFLPVLRVEGEAINTAARRIVHSTTLRFALGALRHLSAIARATRGAPASCEIERFEFAVLPKLLRRPFVLMVHNEGSREDKMDSLLKRYWFLHRGNERLALMLADRIFAVNESIAARIESLSRRLAAKTQVLSVSVDTQRFAPAPFASGPDFRVCFAGRLDAFKDPPLMVSSLALAAERLAAEPVGPFRRLVFDYVGASDPTLVPGFDRIAGLTVRHGIRSAPEVAALMRSAHAGIITSFFEGMPCYLLEMLASGRPVAAIALPQFAPLILAERSGALVSRRETPEASARAMADALLELARRIAAGGLDAPSIAALAQPFSVDVQMGRLFRCHEALAGRSNYPNVSTSAA